MDLIRDPERRGWIRLKDLVRPGLVPLIPIAPLEEPVFRAIRKGVFRLVKEHSRPAASGERALAQAKDRQALCGRMGLPFVIGGAHFEELESGFPGHEAGMLGFASARRTVKENVDPGCKTFGGLEQEFADQVEVLREMGATRKSRAKSVSALAAGPSSTWPSPLRRFRK